MSLKELLLPWKRSWLSFRYRSGEPSVGSSPRNVSRFMPRMTLNSPSSSVSDESDSEELEASSEFEGESYPLGWRRFPTLAALAVPLPFPVCDVGHARLGWGAAREARDCFLLIEGEEAITLGESERALSEEDVGGATSTFFQESRKIGGPSSAEKSHSGRS